MPRRKRKRLSPEDLKRQLRRQRIVEKWMANVAPAAIAKAERVTVQTVHNAIHAAEKEARLAPGTAQQLLARNYATLEDVARVNRAGAAKGDQTATNNLIKAISEQNKMLGVTASGAVNFTLNTTSQGDGSVNYDIEGSIARYIRFIKPDPANFADDPPPSEGPRPYSPNDAARFPRLIEYKPSEPAPPDPPPTKPLDMEAQDDPSAKPFVPRPGEAPNYGGSPYRTELDDPNANVPWHKKPITGKLRRGPLKWGRKERVT